MTTVELCVHMDCSGCETKIRKALKKVAGVDEVDIDMARQKVTVTGWADQRKLLKAVRKTGRRAVLWPYGPDHGMHLYSQTAPAEVVAGAYHVQHPALGPVPASYYNYYEHGYYDSTRHHGYAYGHDYRTPPGSYGGGGSGSVFSDDNPHACAIM